MRRFLKQNGLSITMFAIFLATAIGMSVTGWLNESQENQEHGRARLSYGEYLTGGAFNEALFENWESEFLQMAALVVLTVFLYQKGSTDSKPLRGKAPQDTSSRLSILQTRNWRQRRKAVGHALYSHSLGLALFLLFFLSFSLHAVGGTVAYNDEARMHGQSEISVGEYVVSSRFWFESFQNWQSEFLAVGVLLVLSIYLRERGSQQSKPVGRAYDHKTGE